MAFDSTNYINTWNNSSVLQGQFPNVNDYVDLFRTSGYTPATNAPTTSTPPSGIQTLLQDIDPTINTGDSNENRDVITDPFSGLGYSSENFGLGTNKDLSDYEADAAKVGRTMAGQLNKFGVNVFGALKNIPTPMNLAIKGMQAFQEYQERKAAEEAAAKAAEVESMRASNEAAGRGGYQSSWGNVDSFMSGEGTSGNSGGMGSADPGGSDSMGSFKDGGRIGFADGGSGESSGIYGLLKQGIKNIEKGGLDSLFGERDNFTEGENVPKGSKFNPPIYYNPETKTDIGIAPYVENFSKPDNEYEIGNQGQTNRSIRIQDITPNAGVGLEINRGNFSGGVQAPFVKGGLGSANYGIKYSSDPSSSISADYGKDDGLQFKYRKEFKDGGRIGYAAGGTSFAHAFDPSNYANTWNKNPTLQNQFPNVDDYVNLFRTFGSTPATDTPSSEIQNIDPTIPYGNNWEQIKRDMEDRIKMGSRIQGLSVGNFTEGYGITPKQPSGDYNTEGLNYDTGSENNQYASLLNLGLNPEQIKAISYFDNLQYYFGDKGMMLPEVIDDSNPLASQKFFQTPEEQFAQYQEGLRRSMVQGDSEIYFDPDKTYDTGNYVSPKGIYTFRDIDPDVVNKGIMVNGKEYSSEQDAIDAMGVEGYNQFMATGGRVSLKNGGLATMFRLK